ncbi:MAG TPA: phosphatase PAP2 family protein [Acidimicrobiales bacterium]|nr:phosphatase PAP2 family protein [Acidimicrobiales bacterium]
MVETIRLSGQPGRFVLDARWYLDVNRWAKNTTWAHGFMTTYYDRFVAPIGAGLLFLALLVLVAWWSARRQPQHMAAVIWAFLGALAALGLNQLLVQLLARPRPYNVLSGVEVLVPRVQGYGTPSAHAAVAGAVVCGLLLARRWRLAVLALLGALLLLFADVYVGADYPSAVAGGALFGALVVLLLWPLVSWLLMAAVGRVGESPVGGAVATRGSLKKAPAQLISERPTTRLPNSNAKAMDALRAASEAARNAKPGMSDGA